MQCRPSRKQRVIMSSTARLVKDTDVEQRLNVIGVVTHNRVASLIACVTSFVDHARRHGRAPEFVVMSDGADMRGSLHAVSADTGATIRYAGPAEKRMFADALVHESSVSRDIVEFALFGHASVEPRIGANRNCLALETIGSLVFSADDDTRCRVGAPSGFEDAIAFSTDYEPREFWFFANRSSALVAASPSEIDILGEHERYLGGTVEVDEGRSARVVVTLPGLVGDSGMGSPRFFLTLTGASHERLVASRDDYLSALRSREVHRTVRRPTITHTPFGMTTFLGLDNRDLLPPFFPVARNSDGIFGLTLQRVVEDSWVGFLPSTLVHAPQEPRAFAGDESWTEPARVRMADILISAILVHQPSDRGLDDGERLCRLGRYLRDLAALGADDFDMFLGSAQQLRNLTLISLLQERLAEYRASPAFWADDVKRTIELLQRAPTERNYLAPRDLVTTDDGAARRLARELLSKFGALLEAWPSLVAAATRLRAEGRRLSAPL